MNPYDSEKEISQYRLRYGGIATSNIVYRCWHLGNEQKHHLLNGKTGLPVESEFI